MTTAREMMSRGAECVQTTDSASAAARMMAELGVGALPICGPDNKIKGVVTDRDIVVKVIAKGRDAGTFPVGDLNQAEAVTIGADDDTHDILDTMSAYQVKRLPVIDGDRLVGMVAVADVARSVPHDETGDLIDALSRDSRRGRSTTA